MRPFALLLLPALLAAAPADRRHARRGGPVSTAKEAKAIAEQETGGKAVSAIRIPLNGASGGWEVDVHMPKEERGWRCVIDADTHTVHTKTRIDNPSPKTRK
jgi:uncharacterized membrane protein YkoI